MFQQSADVVAGHFRKPCVSITREQRAYRLSKETGDSAFQAIITVEGFRHEGGRLAVLVCSIANYVFEHLQVVGRSQHRRVTKVDLPLTGGGDFVMVTLDIYSTLREGQ